MNQQQSHGPIFRLMIGAWRALNFTRHLITNVLFFILFLLLVLIVLGAHRAGGGKSLQARTTLMIAPEGQLVEQFSGDPISRGIAKAMNENSSSEVQERDLIQVIDAAAKDQRIERAFLDVDKLRLSGYASARELVAALARFRAAGKQIIGFGEQLTQGQYLVAAQANTLYLDPMGSIDIEGIASFRQYFREALHDKLGIDVNLFRVGEYKSAGEPFILDAASAQAKQADLYWMSDIWNRYLNDVASVRHIDPHELAQAISTTPEIIATSGGDIAQFALKNHLIDAVQTREQVDQYLAQKGIADQDSSHGFRSINYDDYLDILNSERHQSPSQSVVAVVVASGEIRSGEQPTGQIGGMTTSALLRQARKDKAIKAVVLRVNSPGGEVYPSEQIRREIVGLKQAGKPVIVSMGDVAASGGYWISMDANKIYANTTTITGSIGIFGLIPNLTHTLSKLGVHTDGVATTPFAGSMDVTRPMDPKVAQMIQSIINKGYLDFTTRVAQARHQTVAQIDVVARGRVWTGAQAMERGLIDAFGDTHDALEEAARQAKLAKNDYRVVYVEKQSSPFSLFLGNFATTHIGSWVLSHLPFLPQSLLKILPRSTDTVSLIQHQAESFQAGEKRVVPLAHCLCSL